MLEQLAKHEVWLEFLSYKQEKHLLDRSEEKQLTAFILQRRYEPIAQGLIRGTYQFSCPQRKEINKIGTQKKRVVYTYREEENYILKLLAFLLYRYDDRLSPNCYAFRRQVGAQRAFTDMLRLPKLNMLWCYKSDISNYFNSIDVARLIAILREVLDDDPALQTLLIRLIEDDRCVWQGKIIHEQKGAMAGTPISPFLANLYLMEMDQYFYQRGVAYARYSDDIIIFDTLSNMEVHRDAFRSFMAKYHMSANPEKESLSAPGEAWSFLGFQYCNGTIDIAPITVRKLFGKIRRSSRSLRRWMLKHDADVERTLRAFNRKFNRKFFSADAGRELCWSRWFFPLINTTQSLHAIDAYMQQAQRYLVTGTHKKSAYGKAPYDMLRRCGYQPLVSAYYRRSRNT